MRAAFGNLLNKATRDFIEATVNSNHWTLPYRIGTVPTNFEYWKQFKAAKWKTLLEVFATPLLYDHIPSNCHQSLGDLEDQWIVTTQRNFSKFA
jgi:hypothetical protein